MQAITGYRFYIGFGLWARAAHRCRHAFAVLGDWRERERQRHSLARLDDRLLADIGLRREQQDRECTKPFWLP